MESCPTQAVLPLVGLAAEKVIRDRDETVSPTIVADRGRQVAGSGVRVIRRKGTIGPAAVNAPVTSSKAVVGGRSGQGEAPVVT
ncbi:MAG: hypothetical protein R6U98_17220 [Pirellulaceae bacterium]